MRLSRSSTKLLAAAMAAVSPAAAHAVTIADPAGDFLATYTGAKAGELDILSAGATFDGTSFRLSARVNGPIGVTPNTLHVFGVNRGAGTARFDTGPIPAGPGTLFDAAVVLFPGGIVRVVAFQPAGPPVITEVPGGSLVSSDTLELLAPLALLPSTGFAPQDYRFSMWTRQRINIAVDSGNFEIGDFAPDTGGFVATAVPEPAAWATMLAGFALAGGVMRRRRFMPAALQGRTSRGRANA